ncbi:MAG: hypothetical protein RIQ47_1629 [Bacteroidota bacterium]|jgi:transcription elongation GreA/GreB family factor
MMIMPSKKTIYDYCVEYIAERIQRLRSEVDAIQGAANEETKSSAGDKHETARAMAQLEVEMNSKQLAEAERLLEGLKKIDPEKPLNHIAAGALVETSQGQFYIATSIGKVVFGESVIFIVSSDSPIGKLLLGKKSGDSVLFNGNTIQINSVM